MARSDEDVLAGVLRLIVGGRERELPVRSIASARAWKVELGRVLSSSVGGMSFDTLEDTSAIANAVGDRILDLVIAYDETAALGGREYLEASATDAEVYVAFRAILEASYPFVRDLPDVVLVLQGLVRSVPVMSPGASSTSSDSTNGASRPVASSAS